MTDEQLTDAKTLSGMTLEQFMETLTRRFLSCLDQAIEAANIDDLRQYQRECYGEPGEDE